MSKKSVKKIDKKIKNISVQKKRPIEQYRHDDKERINIPEVGLVTAETDIVSDKKSYEYDPHLDPQLVWSGKAEHTSFKVPTVSLHVHERIDTRTIIESVRKINGTSFQGSLFETPGENLPLRDAIEFYKHKHNWTNRLIAGDSLLVMNSLLEKEGMAVQVQMIYFDPPYGIKYGSNFQPFVNNRDVKDGKDDDLSQEPEMIKAFRDTWELGIHSYLTYLRDRLMLAKELLHESGSIFVQISDENVHHVREIMDEVFGKDNFFALINYRSMSPLGQSGIAKIYDYVVWYAKCKSKIKFRPLFVYRNIEDESEFCYIDINDGKYNKLNRNDLQKLDNNLKVKIFKRSVLTSSGYTPSCTYEFELNKVIYKPLSGKSWRTHKDGILELINKHRIFVLGKNPYFKQFHSDFPYTQLENSWHDTAAGFSEPKVYVVQTNTKLIDRFMLMCSDPGDLILDITCGSGTTAFVAEQRGRRWITCDTSRVAITLAKQRLMTSVYEYYLLAHPEEGVGSGFKYKTVPHITLKTIANDEPPEQETIYDQPYIDNSRIRVTGPFTIEAVPSLVVKSPDEITSEEKTKMVDSSISRSGETLRQNEWKDELLRTGIRAKGGKKIEFARLETLSGTRNLHLDGGTKEDEQQRIVVSFGPEYSPLDQRQVELAIEEARSLVPQPKLIVFAAFHFDPEASKDIDELNWPGINIIKAQMNGDLLTDDLKKKRSSNESFWMVGQPDIRIKKIEKGDDKGKYIVEVHGFDYYNPVTGNVESGGTKNIAMWLLDIDYDGRSLFPKQVFFPISGEKEGWSKLAKNLKAEIDEDLIEVYKGTVSLPFEMGEYKRAAIKIIDDRGIESLRIINLD